MKCEIGDSKSKLIACGYREGSLYYHDQGCHTPMFCQIRLQIYGGQPETDENLTGTTTTYTAFDQTIIPDLSGQSQFQVLTNTSGGGKWEKKWHIFNRMKSGSWKSRHQIEGSNGFSTEKSMQMEKWRDTSPNWLLKAALKGSVSITKRPPVPLFAIRSAIALGAGFKQTSGDPCLYIHLDSEGEMFLVTVRRHNPRREERRQNECSEEGAES